MWDTTSPGTDQIGIQPVSNASLELPVRWTGALLAVVPSGLPCCSGAVHEAAASQKTGLNDSPVAQGAPPTDGPTTADEQTQQQLLPSGYWSSRDGNGDSTAVIVAIMLAAVVFDQFNIFSSVAVFLPVSSDITVVALAGLTGVIGIRIWEWSGDTLAYPGRPEVSGKLSESSVEIFDGLAVVLVVSIAVNVVVVLTGMFPDDLGRPSLTLSESLWKIALFTVTVPLEELIFRGYIQRSMARMVPRLVAVTAAAFVFTLFHIQRYAADGFQGVTLLLPLAVVFALGVATGHVYTRINDLAAAVALHFIYNLVVVLGGLLDG